MRTHLLVFFCLLVSSFVASAPVPSHHELVKRDPLAGGEVASEAEKLTSEARRYLQSIIDQLNKFTLEEQALKHQDQATQQLDDDVHALNHQQLQISEALKANKAERDALRFQGKERGIYFPKDKPYWDSTKKTIAASLATAILLSGWLGGWSYGSMSMAKKMAEQRKQQLAMMQQPIAKRDLAEDNTHHLVKRAGIPPNPIPNIIPGVREVQTYPRRVFSYFDVAIIGAPILVWLGWKNISKQNPAYRPSQYGAPKIDVENMKAFSQGVNQNASVRNGFAQLRGVV